MVLRVALHIFRLEVPWLSYGCSLVGAYMLKSRWLTSPFAATDVCISAQNQIITPKKIVHLSVAINMNNP